MKLLEPMLLKILQNEDKMEEYLQLFGNKPSSIDPIIWQVHFTVPAKRRMAILNEFFQNLVKKYTLLFSFLPDHMVLAKVYKILNIPFSVNSSKTSGDELVCFKKLPKIARTNRYLKIYNSFRKVEKNADLGIYEYYEEQLPRPFISYTEFRKECKKKKSDTTFSAVYVLDQLLKNETKKKLAADFASNNTQFLEKHSNQQNNFVMNTHDAGPFQRTDEKRTMANLEETTKCNELAKALPREPVYKIFKSKYPPRLDVQITRKKLGPADLAKAIDQNRNSTSERNKPVLAEEKSCFIVHEILNSPKPGCLPAVVSISNKEDNAIIMSQTSIKNSSEAEEIQIEANIVVEENAIVKNMCKECTSNEDGDYNVTSLTKSVVPDAVQLSSEESVSMVEPSPVVENENNLASLEPNVVYSSNCSNEADCNTGLTCNTSILSTSSSDINRSDEQSKETLEKSVSTSNFDKLYKRTPLEIELKKTTFLKSAEKILEDSSTCEGLENNRSLSVVPITPTKIEKNEVNNLEIRVTSPNASPLLTDSVIYSQRSSASEVEASDERNISSASSPAVSLRKEPTNDMKGITSVLEQCITQMIPAKQENRLSKSKKAKERKTVTCNSTKGNKKPKNLTDENKIKKLTDFVAFSVRKRRCGSNFKLDERDDQTEKFCKKESPISYESTPRSSVSRNSSPGTPSVGSCQLRKAKKLFNEAEESLLKLPTDDKSLSEIESDRETGECELPFPLKNVNRVEKGNVSDSDSSGSTLLSREFRTLSLSSKKSSILFPSQPLKTSPSSISVNTFNSQVSAEITIDQVDKIIEGIVPNSSAGTGFKRNSSSRYSFKASPTTENRDEFSALNFSQISSFGDSLENTSIVEEISNENFVLRHYLTNFNSQDSTRPASQNSSENSFPHYSMKVTLNENTLNECSAANLSDCRVSPFSNGKSPRTAKKLSLRRHCFSLPTKNKSHMPRLKQKRPANVANDDDTSDEDVFRDNSFRSLPIQRRKESSSTFTRPLKLAESVRKVGHHNSGNKENWVKESSSQQKTEKAVADFQRSSVSGVPRKPLNFSINENDKTPAQSPKWSKFEFVSDDDYGSDELNSALDNNLTRFNERKEDEDAQDEDTKSTTSRHFDEEIAQLLTEYATMNAEQQPLSLSSNLTNSESTSFMSTLPVKSNSQSSNLGKSRTADKKQVTSGASNYKDIMWNSYPDSLETALTTPEEKLEEVRNSLREKFINSNSQKLFTSSQKSMASKGNESDSFSFLDWD